MTDPLFSFCVCVFCAFFYSLSLSQALVSAAKDSGKKEEQTLRALCVCTAFKFIFEASEGQEFASLKPVAEAIKKQVDEAGEFLDIKEQHNSTVAEEFVNQIDRVGAKRDALGLYLLLTPPLYVPLAISPSLSLFQLRSHHPWKGQILGKETPVT